MPSVFLSKREFFFLKFCGLRKCYKLCSAVGVPEMEPAVPFLYTVCDINHFLVMRTDNFFEFKVLRSSD